MSRIKALINPMSGSVPDNADLRLAEALEGLGESCETTTLNSDNFLEAIEGAISDAPDMIIVWSGDGTIACALEKAGDSGPPILALPGGTMNLFHKQIHGGDCDWQGCLKACLTEGRTIDVPAGVAGDRRFYVAAMLGSLTDLAAPREAIRKGHILEAVQTLAGSDVLDLRTDMTFDLLDDGRSEHKGHATAAAIFVGDHTSDVLEFAYIDPDNPFELAAAGFGALLSDWRKASGVTSLRALEVALAHEKDYELRATFDGEPLRIASGTGFSRISKAGRSLSAMIE